MTRSCGPKWTNTFGYGQSIASVHTYARFNERDKVETQWAKSADKAEYTLQYARLQVDEFHEDYYEIENNMKAVEKILKNSPELIQRPDEATRYEQNKKEMFFAQKCNEIYGSL